MKRLISLLLIAVFLCGCAKNYAEVSPVETPVYSAVPTAAAHIEDTDSSAEEDVYAGELIARYALQYEGCRYVYGGETPESGFDCSGLVYYVYKNFGYLLYRVAGDQANQGQKIESTSDLLPGDLVCFKKGNYCGHIGIYLGNGEFIQSLDSKRGVIIADLKDYEEEYTIEGRRIVGYMETRTPEEIAHEEELRFLAAEEEARKKAEAEAAASPMRTPEGSPSAHKNPGIYILPTPTPAPRPTDPPEQDDGE